jgi:hypothetical protein
MGFEVGMGTTRYSIERLVFMGAYLAALSNQLIVNAYDQDCRIIYRVSNRALGCTGLAHQAHPRMGRWAQGSPALTRL